MDVETLQQIAAIVTQLGDDGKTVVVVICVTDVLKSLIAWGVPMLALFLGTCRIAKAIASVVEPAHGSRRSEAPS